MSPGSVESPSRRHARAPRAPGRPSPLSLLAALGAAIWSAPTPAAAQNRWNCDLAVHIASLAGDGNDVWGYTDPVTGADYAIFGSEEGTSIYNVTTPSAAYRTGFVAGPINTWRDFATYRNYLYIGSEGGGGIQIVDLANPESPVLAGTYTGAGLATSHTLTADTLRARLYANGANGGMRILSLANPTAPVQIGAYTANYVHDCYARNDTVYAACINAGNVVVLDARAPGTPVTISTFHSERGRTHNCWPTDDLATLFVTDEVTGGRVTSWDISELDDPIQLDGFTAEPSGDAHNVMVRGSFAFVAHYQAGLQVLDISDPSRITHVGNYDTFPGSNPKFSHGAWGVFPYTRNGNIYVSDIESGLFVISFNGRRGGGIAGRVTDEESGAPLAGVEIRIVELALSEQTNGSGLYEIRTAEGAYTISASRDGLVAKILSATIPPGESAPFDITLLDTTAHLAVAPSAGIHATVAAGEAERVPLVLSNAGGGLVRYSIRSDASWLSADPDSGSLALGGADTVAVQFDAASIARDSTLAGTLVVMSNVSSDSVTEIPATMRVFVPDLVAPQLSLSLLQNPILSQHVEIVVVADERLRGPVRLVADDQEIPLSGNASDSRPLFRGRYTLASTASVLFTYCGEDTAENRTEISETFVAYETPPGGAARVAGPLGAFEVAAPEGALPGGAFLVLRARPVDEREGLDAPSGASPTFEASIGPEGLVPRAPLRLTIPLGGAPETPGSMVGAIARREPTGWVLLPTYLSPDGRALVAETDRLGAFRIQGGGAPIARLPARARLHPATPNPSSGGSLLAFDLAERADVRLQIFDASGRLVRTLVEGSRSPGANGVRWDGRSDVGRALPPGTYVARLATPDGILGVKLTVVR